jgi:hypothetical protein
MLFNHNSILNAVAGDESSSRIVLSDRYLWNPTESADPIMNRYSHVPEVHV